MAAGSMQFLVNGAWTKRSHVGHAAMSGLIAATLAKEGAITPDEAFSKSYDKASLQTALQQAGVQFQPVV